MDKLIKQASHIKTDTICVVYGSLLHHDMDGRVVVVLENSYDKHEALWYSLVRSYNGQPSLTIEEYDYDGCDIVVDSECLICHDNLMSIGEV